MTDADASAISQLEAVVARYRELRGRSKWDDLSDLPASEYTGCIAAARAAIERVSGRGSAYVRHAESVLEQHGGSSYCGHAGNLSGIADSLRRDVEGGYLRNLQELVHAELFADFLEMSEHLLEAGYKDAAAVISGSALEAHLRQLATKHGVEVTTTVNGEERPKKAERINTDLASARAYGKLEQKSVTAWLDLRNKAAHGDYGAYSKEQVGLHIASIRDFILRYPA
jgi:hypothetical protein